MSTNDNFGFEEDENDSSAKNMMSYVAPMEDGGLKADTSFGDAGTEDGYDDDEDFESMYRSASKSGTMHNEEDSDLTESPRPEAVKEEKVAPSPVAKEKETGVERVAPQPQSASFIPPAVSASSVEDVARIIRVVDAFRAIPKSSQSVVLQFIHNTSEPPTDEASLAVRVLNIDPLLSKTMMHIRTAATQTERVDRVFYILKLSDKELQSLGVTVGRLSPEENGALSSGNIGDRIEFSRMVEKEINNMDSSVVQYISATEDVLSAAD